MNQRGAVNNLIYATNISPDVNEYDLNDFFKDFGQCHARIYRDRLSHHSLGRASITFMNPQDAMRAMEVKNYDVLKNKTIRMTWFERDPYRRKSGVGNLFVKNIDKDITDKELHNKFSQYGNILSCKIARDIHEQSKGFGFIQYDSKAEADKAVSACNETLLGQKTIYVMPFLKKTERPKQELLFNNLHVKNIPTGWTNDDLSKLFLGYGEIISAVVIPDDKSDANNRGFGFVCFQKPEDAKKALDELDNSTQEDKKLVIHKAQKKEERERELKKKFEEIRRKRQEENDPKTIYVKNLDDKVDDEQLKELFTKYGTITSAKVMSKKKEGGREFSLNFGFVTFGSMEEAQKAITELHQKPHEGRTLQVFKFQRRDKRAQFLRSRMNRAGPRFNQFPGMNNMYGNMMNEMRPRMPAVMNNARIPGYAGYQMYPAQQRAMMYAGQQRPRAQQPGRQHHGQQGHHQQMPGGRGMGQQRARGPQHHGQHPQQQQQAQMQQAKQVASKAQEILAINQDTYGALDENDKIQYLGEKLYTYIETVKTLENAGKLTGMLLEMDKQDLINLFVNIPALDAKIEEAVEVLKEHEGTG